MSKFYQGIFQNWINYSFGAILYEIALIALVLLIQPRLNPKWVSFWVFLVTAFLETLQLWSPPFLEAIRSTFIGRLAIGTTFAYSDFVYYVIGCIIGGWMFQVLQSRFIPSQKEL
ncbi:MAG: DUF2809 domain-containing protein [Microcoleaceae cyanobacterium]